MNKARKTQPLTTDEIVAELEELKETVMGLNENDGWNPRTIEALDAAIARVRGQDEPRHSPFDVKKAENVFVGPPVLCNKPFGKNHRCKRYLGHPGDCSLAP